MASIPIPDFKMNWALARKILYIGILLWVIAVRFMGIDPFGLRAALPIAWLFDAISLAALAILLWHLWPKHPKIA